MHLGLQPTPARGGGNGEEAMARRQWAGGGAEFAERGMTIGRIRGERNDVISWNDDCGRASGAPAAAHPRLVVAEDARQVLVRDTWYEGDKDGRVVDVVRDRVCTWGSKA